MSVRPDDAVAEVLGHLQGEPVFLAGSCIAALEHDIPGGFSDLDVFVPTSQVLVSTIQTLINHGYTLDDRFDRVWHRWLRYGFKGWHTNSMRMHSPNDVETNVVYKIVDGHPTTSLSQVLESFDFGLLGLGYDVEQGLPRDLRPYLFPGMDPNGPLPLMPGKRDAWLGGFISQYNGLREAGRYAKYFRYGFDMSMVRDDLVTGYKMASAYHQSTFEPDKQLLATIYQTLADRITNSEVDELMESYKSLDFKDPLDLIMEALE